ncbi:NB-ARC domain-containing protein [Streptomyces sp. NPDC055749]
MLGDLLFGVGLPPLLASGVLIVAMGLVAGLTFAGERRAVALVGDAAADRRHVDQLKPAPVLVGRVELVQALCSTLRDVGPAQGAINTADPTQGRANVVVLHGAGGTGKTTLATYAAHQVKASYPDARLYIDLRGDDNGVRSTDALEHFLRSLGVTPTEIPGPVGDRAAMFRSLVGPLRALVFLDNAKSTEQIRPLIPAGPGCAVLITSRRRLTIGNISHRGMVRVSLPEEDEALAVLSHYAGRERVLEDPAAALKIVQFCGRLPLALEITGARLSSRPDLTLNRMCARLDDERSRIGELRYDDASLQACLLISYRDLSKEARQILSGISALPRGRLTNWHVAAMGGSALSSNRVVDELMETCMMDASGTSVAGNRYRPADQAIPRIRA